jgi:hypothetical protein
LTDKKEAFQVSRDQTAKILGCVVREGLNQEDPCIVDEAINGTELADRGLCDVRGTVRHLVFGAIVASMEGEYGD